MNLLKIDRLRTQLQLYFLVFLLKLQGIVRMIDLFLEIVQLPYHILLKQQQFTDPVLLGCQLTRQLLFFAHFHHQRWTLRSSFELLLRVVGRWLGIAEGTVVVISSPFDDLRGVVESPSQQIPFAQLLSFASPKHLRFIEVTLWAIFVFFMLFSFPSSRSHDEVVGFIFVIGFLLRLDLDVFVELPLKFQVFLLFLCLLCCLSPLIILHLNPQLFSIFVLNLLLVYLLLGVATQQPTLEIPRKGDIIVEVQRLCWSIHPRVSQLRLLLTDRWAIDRVVVVVVGGIGARGEQLRRVDAGSEGIGLGFDGDAGRELHGPGQQMLVQQDSWQ